MNVLVIGSTGFIGKDIVRELASKDINITLLVRNKDKARYLEALNVSKIQLITGDLTAPGLGLSAEDKEIALSCDSIIHCGGPMDISLSRQEAKIAFFNGAKHVTELAQEINRNQGLKKFIHVVGYMSPFTDDSTDWLNYNVYGDIHPLLAKDSYYEQMKFQADILVRQIALKDNLPLVVINPPTVIGNKGAGRTEQLAGFGLFLKIIRNGFLPVIPGGKAYRLPVIYRDTLTDFIVDSLLDPSKLKGTYTLVQDKTMDLDMPQLMEIVTNSMNMSVPKMTVPVSVLKTVMSLGGSRITGIPKSSLNFLTDRAFDNQQVKRDFSPSLVDELSVSNSLPLVVADIDHTLTFGEEETAPFVRKSINQTSFYHLEGVGKAVALIHGLFSEASDLFSLGVEINKRTGQPVWIMDLPGFG